MHTDDRTATTDETVVLSVVSVVPVEVQTRSGPAHARCKSHTRKSMNGSIEQEPDVHLATRLRCVIGVRSRDGALRNRDYAQGAMVDA